MSCMYNMPPPWLYPPIPPTTGGDSWEKAFKFYEKLERKKLKEEEKKKKDGKKGGGDGPSPFQVAILLTAISPLIGPMTLWAASYMLAQTFYNLQGIVPH